MITIVSAGQSLLDVCLQELGAVDALYELADANGLTITATLRPGQQLQVPAAVLSRPEVVSYFAARQQRINVPDQLRQAGAVLPPDDPDDPDEPAGRLQDFLNSDFLTSDFK